MFRWNLRSGITPAGTMRSWAENHPRRANEATFEKTQRIRETNRASQRTGGTVFVRAGAAGFLRADCAVSERTSFQAERVFQRAILCAGERRVALGIEFRRAAAELPRFSGGGGGARTRPTGQDSGKSVAAGRGIVDRFA